MFGFLKPEVSGFKNVLNGYFQFQAQTGLLEGVESDLVKTFAVFYYQQRLGPPLIRDSARSIQMYNVAMRTAEAVAEAEGSWTLVAILKGLLAAEGIDWRGIDYVALRKAAFKFQAIPQGISGL